MNPPDETLALICLAAPAEAAPRLMYMPAGLQTITPTQAGRPVQVQVLIEPATAAALEQQREALLNRGKTPFFDFNHEDRSASFWPQEFAWSDDPQPGVYVTGEWSREGRDGIEGKAWRTFSPVFYVDDVQGKPARVICQPLARPNMGGLVNDPAFTSIQPFFAKEAEPEPAPTPAPALTIEPELAAKVRDLSRQNEALVLQARQQREREVSSVIAAAVARGAIPPQDSQAIRDWTEILLADPAKQRLLARAARPAVLGGRLTPPAAALGVRVVANAPKDLLNAYGELQARQAGVATLAEKADLARQAARIFARDIRDNKQCIDMPLEAANSPGTLSGTLVSQRTLELLKLTFPVLSSITTDFSDQSAQFGQTIVTRVISIPAVETYDPATGWPVSDQTATDVPITIDNHKGVPIVFDANTLASTVRNLFTEFAPAAAYALAKDLVDHLYALILPGDFPASPLVAALADFDRASVIGAGVVLNQQGVPMGAAHRSLLLNSPYFGRLAEDPGLVSLAAFGQNQMLQTGVLPDVHGFRTIDAPNLPENGADLAGFAFGRSALLAASRLPNDYTSVLPGASFGTVTVITDPDLGLSALQTQYVNHDRGTAHQRIAWMYGVARGQALAGQLITSQ